MAPTRRTSRPSSTTTPGGATPMRRLFPSAAAQPPPPPPVRLVTQAEIDAELALAEEIAERALAASTRRLYTANWEAFVAWCAARRVSSLPADPKVVATHLAWYATARDAQGRILPEEDGCLARGVHPTTVGTRLAAINKAHADAGFPPSGTDIAVRKVVAGIRRTHGVAPDQQKDAIDMPRLRLLLAAAETGPVDQVRRQTLVLLSNATGATPGQLARLAWTDFTYPTSADTGPPPWVDIALPPSRRGADRAKVRVRASRRPRSCPVHALITLQRLTAGEGPVFAAADGRPVTRQAIRKYLAAGSTRVATDAQTTFTHG